VLIAAGTAVLAGLAAVGTALVVGANGDAAAPVLYGRPGTVTRIDPERNAVADVVTVGTDPEAVAVHGRRVWVYNYSDGTVASVDERTKHVQTTGVPARPVDVSAYAGPVLAADAGGAWFIGVNDSDRPVLVRITGTGRRTFYHLDRVPWGVAVGYGAVWIVAHGERDSQLLRIDPVTGEITQRTRFTGAAAIDSVAVGLGSVWVVGASGSTLYRIHPRTGELSGRVRVGGSARAPRPYLMRGLVWVGLTVLDPQTLGTVMELSCCPADAGEDTGGFGSVWWSDAPTGSVVRWGTDWEVEQTIRVLPVAPGFGGGCLTSIAAGAGGIWVTVASSFNDVCGP
jgi:DNA-binding beta-propeller fold protein YncE